MKAVRALAGLGGAAFVATSSVTATTPLSRVGPVSLMVVGTSLTARGGWGEPLRIALERQQHRPVRLIQVAMPGATSRWLAAQVAAAAARRPDIVLIEAAANDASLVTGVSLAESRANMHTILTLFRRHSPASRLIVMAMNPATGWRGLVRPRLDRFADAQLAEAAVDGAERIDFRPAWRALSAADQAAAIPDGLHPRPEFATRLMLPLLVLRLSTPLGPKA